MKTKCGNANHKGTYKREPEIKCEPQNMNSMNKKTRHHNRLWLPRLL